MQFISAYTLIDVLVVFLLGFFIVFLLRLQSGNRLGHRLLAAFLASLACSYMDGVFLSFGFRFHYSYPFMVYLTMSGDYLVGPLLYLYVLSRTRPDFRLERKHLAHFVVFAGHFTFIFFRYHIKSIEEKRSILASHQVFSYTEVYGLVLLSYAHYFVYMVLVVVTLRQYQRHIKQVYSDLHKANLNWLLVICTGLLLGGLMRLLNNLLWLEMPEATILQILDFKLFAISAVFIFACTVVYKSLQQPDVLRLTTTQTEAVRDDLSPARELTAARRAELKQTLLAYMETARPHLNPDLTLYELARDMQISSHRLSDVINAGCRSNFYDFINGYRVRECMARLADAENQKYISQIMYECGFNSKSVFNAAFKRATLQTPSEYRKQHSSSVIHEVIKCEAES